MDVQIELPAEQWHNLLGGIDPNSPAYFIVRSSIEINEAPATRPLSNVVLVCDEQDAVTLLGAARRFAPEAVLQIETALENPLDR